jgi:hypothetical protein
MLCSFQIVHITVYLMQQKKKKKKKVPVTEPGSKMVYQGVGGLRLSYGGVC